MKAQTTPIPTDFEASMSRLLGSDGLSRLLHALGEEPTVSIRLNPAKPHGEAIGGERVAWWHLGRYLAGRPQFTFDPLLHAGCYYVQDASSMFLGHIVSQCISEPATVLDLCAAPGGKTTLLLDALPQGSVVVCNEIVAQRASILAENVQKWGRAEVMVTCDAPADYARSGLAFDAIVCDVPCSGEGMFRKDEVARSEWSAAAVERCQARQRDIVASAWQCLKPGGLMIYSTCTLNTMENEENVDWICAELGAETIGIGIQPTWGIAGSLLTDAPQAAYRFMPGTARGEGQFMAALRKVGGDAPTEHRPRRKGKAAAPTATAASACRQWLAHPDDMTLIDTPQAIMALPHRLAPIYDAARQSLRIVHAGVTIGQAKGRDIVPSASLALSTELRRDAFATAELPYQQAMAYLRREPMSLPADTPRGLVLLTYEGAALGFAKNLGTRANNLHPQEWRVRSTHLPSEDERPRVLG